MRKDCKFKILDLSLLTKMLISVNIKAIQIMQNTLGVRVQDNVTNCHMEEGLTRLYFNRLDRNSSRYCWLGNFLKIFCVGNHTL